MSCLYSLFKSQKKSDRTPIWFMRQAGRYLPEYRAIRQNYPDFLAFISAPQDAATVTLQPLERYDIDAAIIFSDILMIPWALGQGVRFEVGEGPKLDAIHCEKGIQKLALSHKFDQTIKPTLEALSLCRSRMPKDKSLIGFSGSPWTLSCYMIEGQGSKTFQKTAKFARTNPKAYQDLQTLLIESIVIYLSSQIKAGADVVQLFDSWAGLCPESLRNDYVFKPNQEIVRRLKLLHPEIPIIAFPKGIGPQLLEFVHNVGPDGVSFDHTAPLEDLKQMPCVVQGGPSPELLLEGGGALYEMSKQYLQAFKDKPYIFNLGHGIIKETNPENLASLIAYVRDFEKERWAG